MIDLRLSKPVKGRLALFASVLSPMSIWLLTDAPLARPWQVIGWAVCVSLWAASLPGKFVHWCAWGQLLATPLTMGWVGAVALSGMGPSVASTASVSAGAFREVATAASMAFHVPAFLAVMLLSLVFTVLAILMTRGMPAGFPKYAAPLFLACLLPLSTTSLPAFPRLEEFASSESRVSVPWLFNLELFKEESDLFLENVVTSGPGKRDATRHAADAPHLFDMQDGLAVFIVGESLRADALSNSSRGLWSQALIKRLKDGLGVRLPDACSGSNATFASVPRLMTGVEVDDTHGAATKPTVLAIARAAGAKTAYITNHETWVVAEVGHDFILKTSSMHRNAYDDMAIEAMSDFVKRTTAPAKAVMLHLYGQHFLYQDRYPANLFPPEPPELSADALLELRYARAAENGARQLLAAAKMLDEQTVPAYLVFTSDHGENLPSDNTGKRFHAGPRVGRNDTTVPVIVLWNSAFAASGRALHLEPLLKAKGLIAHKDVARAWLSLAGMPGELTPTAEPKTWGNSGLPTQKTRDVACSLLNP